MEKIRLQKFFTDCGVLSRRAAESEIAAGNVTVNGRVAGIGDKVDPEKDIVLWNEKRICGKKSGGKQGNRHEYIMLNKPRGFITTMSDEKGRKCVASLVEDVGTRVYPVGRLDRESQGLLLFTDDGDFANLLTHPSHEIPKIYHVKVSGEITYEQLDKLKSPMDIDGYRIKPVSTDIIALNENGCTLKMTLYEGRNRQIRKMCEKVGLEVVKLTRVAIGSVGLGDLKIGSWRRLSRAEVEYLKNGKE